MFNILNRMYVRSLRQFGGKVREIFDVSDWGVCPMFGFSIVYNMSGLCTLGRLFKPFTTALTTHVSWRYDFFILLHRIYYHNDVLDHHNFSSWTQRYHLTSSTLSLIDQLILTPTSPSEMQPSGHYRRSEETYRSTNGYKVIEYPPQARVGSRSSSTH